jgi:hypothetical protein
MIAEKLFNAGRSVLKLLQYVAISFISLGVVVELVVIMDWILGWLR